MESDFYQKFSHRPKKIKPHPGPDKYLWMVVRGPAEHICWFCSAKREASQMTTILNRLLKERKEPPNATEAFSILEKIRVEYQRERQNGSPH